MRAPSPAAHLELELYGFDARIRASPGELIDSIRSRLMPPWQPAASARLSEHEAVPSERIDFDLAVTNLGGGAYSCLCGESELAVGSLDEVLFTLVNYLRFEVATRSREKIFVHAGVVGVNGRAIVISGPSYSGKTSLVAALVRAGASYLSDEYAVLDGDGLVYPFAKALSIRGDHGESHQHWVETLGGQAATAPLPVRLVVLATYRAGATWQPTRLSEGDAVLALMRHTSQTRERPAASLSALARVVEQAVVLSGERGSASEVAPALIAEVNASHI